MAYVKVITTEFSNELEEKINKEIKGKSINDFTIQFKAQESYPNGKESNEDFERFYTALIIFKDDIKTSNNFKPKHNNKLHYKNQYNKVHHKEG